MTERTLDWVPRYDERSRDFAIRTTINARGAPVPDTARLWRPGFVLDQGREGACVGYGWTGELIGAPRPDPYVLLSGATNFAKQVYRGAQRIDEWEGENYEGTSVLAGAKVVRDLNLIGSYRWAFSIEDVRDALITTGPVVIGVNWYSGMYDTDRNGIVRVSGDLVGGHCLFLYEYHPRKRLPGDWFGRHRVFRWRNSWGPSYGHDGSGYIHWNDLKRLLAEGGEACVPIDRKTVRL
jgi:hypothetical protein